MMAESDDQTEDSRNDRGSEQHELAGSNRRAESGSRTVLERALIHPPSEIDERVTFSAGRRFLDRPWSIVVRITAACYCFQDYTAGDLNMFRPCKLACEPPTDQRMGE